MERCREWRDVHRLEDNFVKMNFPPRLSDRFDSIPDKIPACYFGRNLQFDSKIYMENQKH